MRSILNKEMCKKGIILQTCTIIANVDLHISEKLVCKRQQRRKYWKWWFGRIIHPADIFTRLIFMKENFHHLQNVLTIHSIYINFCALTLSNRTSNIKFVYNSCPRYVAKFIYQFTVTEKINIQVPKLNTYPHLPLMFSWKDGSWIILEILCRLSWTFKNELLFVVVVVVLGLFWKFSAPSLDIQEWAPVICISLWYFLVFCCWNFFDLSRLLLWTFKNELL